MKTLKKLAENIIDGIITGNQDQIVTNWVHDKFKSLPDEVIDSKIDSAIRNFETTKEKILRERAKETIAKATT